LDVAPPNADVQAVFEYWLAKTGRDGERFRLTKDRSTVIRARLKRFTVDELKLAIDGVMLSDYHTQKPEFTDLTSCFRKDERVETHIARAAAPPMKKNGRPTSRADRGGEPPDMGDFFAIGEK